MTFALELDGQDRVIQGFPGGPVGNNPPCSAGDVSSIPDPGRSHMPQSSWAPAPPLRSLLQLLKSLQQREATEMRSPSPQRRGAPALRTYRKPEHSNEDPTQPKIIFFFKDRGVRFPCLSFACHTYPIRQLRNKGRYADRQKGRDKAPEAGDWHAKSWGHREWNVMEQSAGARPDWGPPWELGCFLLRTVEDHGKNLSM